MAEPELTEAPMSENLITHRPLGLTLAVAALIIDQWNKFSFIELMASRNFVPMEVASFFNLVMAWNKGVSFSMFAEYDARLPLAFMALAVAAVMLFWMWKEADKLTAAGLGLIIGGAVGNAIDRFNYGAVADFFDFHISGYHWPAFNFADSFIFIGVAFLLWRSFRGA